MSERSLINLNWLNLLVAQMQMAFGAFLSASLAAEHWSTQQIGVALTISTGTAMLFQVPSGALVDALHSKRVAAAAGILGIISAATLIGISPHKYPVFVAEALQGAASCVLGPAIAAITLALTHQDTLGERFGRNVRFSAIGSMLAAALMGAIGFWFSNRAIFYLSTLSGIAALAAVRAIPEKDIEEAPERTDHVAVIPRHHPTRREDPKRKVAFNPVLLIFAACVALFQLGNAAVLPIAAAAAQRADGHTVQLLISAAIIVPQALAAWISPYLGRAAHHWGRRWILLLGFAPLPIRALLFASIANPYAIVLIQALDGISAAVVGMIVPLVVADITRRCGRFNLAMGVIGLAVGVGATVSTTFAGAIADHFDNNTAYVALATAGLAACLLVLTALPETGHRKHHHQIKAPRSLISSPRGCGCRWKSESARRTLSCIRARPFLNPNPMAKSGEDAQKGLLFRDTRLISYWRVQANGQDWDLVSGGAISHFAARVLLTNRTIVAESSGKKSCNASQRSRSLAGRSASRPRSPTDTATCRSASRPEALRNVQGQALSPAARASSFLHDKF